MAALALEIEDGVHHVLDHAGPGDLAVLGDMADEDGGNAAPLGVADHLVCRGADLGDRTGCGLDMVEPHGLDRIDYHEVGPFGVERGEDVAERCLGAEAHRRIGQPEPLRAHLHLRRRLFAREVKRLQPRSREGGGGLQEQGRFADAGVAADQDRRGRHQPAAQDPVELVQPRGAARRWRIRGGEVGERHVASLGDLGLRPGRKRRLLDDGIPCPAGLAPPGPFRIGRAAGGAGELQKGFRHASVLHERDRAGKRRQVRPQVRPQVRRASAQEIAKLASTQKLNNHRPQAVWMVVWATPLAMTI